MKFRVENMTCGGCVRSVTKAIAHLDGAAQVDADLAAGTVSVTTSATPAAVIKALDEAGFAATAA